MQPAASGQALGAHHLGYLLAKWPLAPTICHMHNHCKHHHKIFDKQRLNRPAALERCFHLHRPCMRVQGKET
eukprot:1932316-Amphidinium_carterae.2